MGSNVVMKNCSNGSTSGIPYAWYIRVRTLMYKVYVRMSNAILCATTSPGTCAYVQNQKCTYTYIHFLKCKHHQGANGGKAV